MKFGVAGIDPQRRAELIKVLDIDISWRLHKVSDGQRRRVQICRGLLKPFKVLLLDEITVDLDVLARADLKFLRKECEERGATIIYATHIFDGLEEWPSHIVSSDLFCQLLSIRYADLMTMAGLQEGSTPPLLVKRTFTSARIEFCASC